MTSTRFQGLSVDVQSIALNPDTHQKPLVRSMQISAWLEFVIFLRTRLPLIVSSIVMDTTLLETKFNRIGARLKMANRPTRRSRTSRPISLDVQADRKGEFF